MGFGKDSVVGREEYGKDMRLRGYGKPELLELMAWNLNFGRG